MRKLSKEEKIVMHEEKMEAPFLNIYYLHEDQGHYHCRQCDAVLFDSKHKFHSGSGWPCFDDHVPHALVKENSGAFVHVFCKSCHGFIGKYFTGEGITKRNERYNVSSLALRFKGRDGERC